MMTDEERREEYRREDQEWDRKQREAAQAQASKYFREGKTFLGLFALNPALAAFNEDVRINPAEPYSYMARGDCRLKLGHRKPAAEDFLRAAELFRRQNQPKKAEEAAERAFRPR